MGNRELIKLRRKKVLFVVLFNLLFMIGLILWKNPIFATNDDYRMRLIVSGSYTGVPSRAAIFLQLPLSWIISSLYKLNGSINWYGSYYFITTFISVSLIHFIIIEKANNFKDLILKNILYFYYLLFFISFHIVLPQFTLQSAILASAALFVAFDAIDKLKSNKRYHSRLMVLVILINLSFMTRMKVFLMFGPIFVIILGINYQSLAKKVKVIIPYVLLTIALIGSSFIINNRFYSSSEYKAYSDFNVSRAAYYDYDVRSEFSEHQQFYESIGVTHAIYDVINSRSFDLDEVINQETLDKITDYNKKVADESLKSKASQGIVDVILSFRIDKLTSEFAFVALLIVLLFVTKIKFRDLKGLLTGVFVESYCLLLTFVIIMQGRIIDRLNQSITLMLVSVLIFLISEDICQFVDSLRDKLGFKKSEGLSILIVLSVLLVPVELNRIKRYHGYANTTASRLDLLQEYTKQNQDNFYFYNALDFIGSSEAVYKRPASGVLNIDSLGNWNVHSPNYEKRNMQFGFTSAIEGLTEKENVFYAEIGHPHSSFEELLSEKYEKKLQPVDIIKGEGFNIVIYEVVEKNR